MTAFFKSQATLMGASLLLVVLAGIGILPILSRVFSTEQLAVITLILLLNSLFGVLDILRPVYVSVFAKDPRIATFGNIFSTTLMVAIPTSIIVAVMLMVFMSAYFNVSDILFLSAAAFMFVQYNGYWAVLDSNERVGTAYLVRSTGTFALFCLFAIDGIFGEPSIDPAVLFLLVQMLVYLCFFALARQYFAKEKSEMPASFWRSSLSTAQQNLAKLSIEFFDRLIVAQVFPPSIVVQYNLAFELVSKSNLPVQLGSAFGFPKLCAGTLKPSVLFGYVFSYAMVVTALGYVLLFVGPTLFPWYFGKPEFDLTFYFCAMLACFSNYAMAFSAQAILRSRGDFKYLSYAFGLPAVISLLCVWPAYQMFSTAGIIACLFIARLPGLFSVLRLSAVVPSALALTLALVGGNTVLLVISLLGL